MHRPYRCGIKQKCLTLSIAMKTLGISSYYFHVKAISLYMPWCPKYHGIGVCSLGYVAMGTLTLPSWFICGHRNSPCLGSVLGVDLIKLILVTFNGNASLGDEYLFSLLLDFIVAVLTFVATAVDVGDVVIAGFVFPNHFFFFFSFISSLFLTCWKEMCKRINLISYIVVVISVIAKVFYLFQT